jgi:hypothetical protein
VIVCVVSYAAVEPMLLAFTLISYVPGVTAAEFHIQELA